MKIKLLFIALCLIGANAHAQGNKTVSNIEYHHSDNISQGLSALLLDETFIVFGPNRSMTFDNRFRSSSGSRPLGIKGYPQFSRLNKDNHTIIAGLNHRANSIFSKDSRQNIIALLYRGVDSGTKNEFRELGDRLPYGLEINANNQPVLLAGGGGHYTLSVFSPNLMNVRKSIKFGNGQKAALTIIGNGNYAVVGFEDHKKNSDVAPVYWEFNPELEQIYKEHLGVEVKKRGRMDAAMAVLSHEDNVYAVYGWDMSGFKREIPDEVRIRKIKGLSGQWDKEQTLPYHPGVRFFVSNKGSPYALYPRMESIERIDFKPENGKKTKRLLNRPIKPVQCFPPKWKYEIIDVLEDSAGNQHVVINGDPLNHPEVGCVTIGQIPGVN